MTNCWYIRTKRGDVGPLSADKIRRLALEGKLKPAHLVSQDQKKWTEASNVKGLKFESVSVQEETPIPPAPNSQDLHVPSVVQQPGPASADPPTRTDKASGQVFETKRHENLWQQIGAWFIVTENNVLMWRRIGAWFIDSLVAFGIQIICIVGGVGTLLLFSVGSSINREPDFLDKMIVGLTWLFLILMPLVYILDRDNCYTGIGKRLLGIATLDKAGKPCGSLRSMLRNVLLLIPGMPIVEFVIATTREDNKRLGDIIAGTHVTLSHDRNIAILLNQGKANEAVQIAKRFLKQEPPFHVDSTKQKIPIIRHVIKRQIRVCDRLLAVDTNAKLRTRIEEIRETVSQQLVILNNRKLFSWTSNSNANKELVSEYDTLQRNKIRLSDEL